MAIGTVADEALQTKSVRGLGLGEEVRTLNYITTSMVYVLRNISRVLIVGAVAAANDVTLTSCLAYSDVNG